jgi:hypothetical protein
MCKKATGAYFQLLPLSYAPRKLYILMLCDSKRGAPNFGGRIQKRKSKRRNRGRRRQWEKRIKKMGKERGERRITVR